jgi:hypothetical protein
MKFLLTALLCSGISSTCLTPHTFPEAYDDVYSCMMDGYTKSLEKMEEIGREEVNTHHIFVKFSCDILITPPKKPVPKSKIDKEAKV